MKQLYPIIIMTILLLSCEKRIAIEIDDSTPVPVIEGSIETGQPPIVQLTWSQGYFDPINAEILDQLRIKNANVSITVDGINYPLTSICSSNIPDSLKLLAAGILGISEADLSNFDFCFYTDLSFSIIGTVGKTYELQVEIDGNIYEASTQILDPVPVDTTYFGLYDNFENLGVIKGYFSDPPNIKNHYRVFCRRINRYADGTIKDPFFIPPFGATFDDRFFDGLTFEFQSFRGAQPNSDKADDQGDEAGLFRIGDTVVFKYCHIDQSAAEFLISFEQASSSQGSPFASPSIIKSNITGPQAFGGWVGYSPYFDTIYCYP